MPVAIHSPADWPQSSRNLSRFYTEFKDNRAKVSWGRYSTFLIWILLQEEIDLDQSSENWLKSSLTLEIFSNYNAKRINILCFVSLSLNWYLRDPHPTLFALRLTAAASHRLLKYEFESGLLINCFLSLSPRRICNVLCPVSKLQWLTLLAIYSCITDLNHGLWGPGPWHTRASRLWHWSVNIRGHSGDTRWASKDKYWSWIIKINPDWVHQCPVSDIYRKIKMTPQSVFCVSIIYQDHDKLSENKNIPI